MFTVAVKAYRPILYARRFEFQPLTYPTNRILVHHASLHFIHSEFRRKERVKLLRSAWLVAPLPNVSHVRRISHGGQCTCRSFSGPCRLHDYGKACKSDGVGELRTSCHIDCRRQASISYVLFSFNAFHQKIFPTKRFKGK